jgi:aminoglycoside 6'-N-acetyltransferase
MTEARFQAGDLRVRPLTGADVPDLARWLSDPRVLEFYGGRDQPSDAAAVRAEYLRPGDPVERCLVEQAGMPFGYLQLYRPDDPAWDLPADEVTWAMDLFIGEPARWNQGIGTRLVRAAVDHLVRDRGADRVLIDPEARNPRAIRCYEKAGFRKVKLLPEAELHEGVWEDCWLMAFTPDEP